MTRHTEIFTTNQRIIIRRICRNYIREIQEVYENAESEEVITYQGGAKRILRIPFIDIANTIANQTLFFHNLLSNPDNIFQLIKGEADLWDVKDAIMTYEVEEQYYDNSVIWGKLLVFQNIINNLN